MPFSIMTMTSMTIFPTAPHTVFALFGQSPRDNFVMYEDLYHIIRPQHAQRQRSTSGGSMKFSLKKIFGGL